LRHPCRVRRALRRQAILHGGSRVQSSRRPRPPIALRQAPRRLSVPARAPKVIPALDSTLCHHATVWSGCWFALNLSLNQTATLVLLSAFQGVPPPEGERFGGWPWPTNCSSEASPSRRPRTGCVSCSRGSARSNRRR